MRAGDMAEARIGNDLVLTGYVFATPASYDKSSITFGIAGRSRTADLVDCAAVNKPGQFKRQSVLAIVRALAAPYGIEVVSEVGEGEEVADHTIQPGESAFESIDRLLKLSRLLSTDDQYGRLVLAKPGSAGRAHDALEVGQNILKGDAQFDFSQTFSEYQVKGQGAGSDAASGKKTNELSASVIDGRVPRKRVLAIQQSGQMTAKLARDWAEYEREARMSRALQSSYTVQGWRQSNGALWRHNMIVRVVDPILGFDRDMLITEINYRMENGGTTCQMSVAPPDGFEAAPPDGMKKVKGKKRNKKGGKDDFEFLVPADWDKEK